MDAGTRNAIVVAGTLDTKGVELQFVRDILLARDLPVQLVDLSTSASAKARPADFSREPLPDIHATEIAAFHPDGAQQVFTADRGTAVAAMTQAFERWIRQQSGILGLIGAGGSGATALLAPAMRALPFGVPKVMISTVASGEVSQYVGPADIMMLYSVADIQGLNAITREVLTNGTNALAGMVEGRRQACASAQQAPARPAAGLSMFGVTTPCVQQLISSIEQQFECFVFHATGIGGQSMENLIDNGRISAILDMTTTEVCDRLAGGIFPAAEDRFGSIIRSGIPYTGSCGALDMVNFAALETVPEKYRKRQLYQHNAQITLMRTNAEENAKAGQFIAKSLNRMPGEVRFFLPLGGVSALDTVDGPFYDPQANEALFSALQENLEHSSRRRLIRLPYHINDPQFSAQVAAEFLALNPTGEQP